MGVSMLMNPCPSKKSMMARLIVARTRKMAHWRLERNQWWRLSIKNSTPCSLGVMGYSSTCCNTCTLCTPTS